MWLKTARSDAEVLILILARYSRIAAVDISLELDILGEAKVYLDELAELGFCPLDSLSAADDLSWLSSIFFKV